MYDTLADCRDDWEKSGDLSVVAEVTTPDICWVVLINEGLSRDDPDVFTCHRYFKTVMGYWDVSVDKQSCDAETAIKWGMESVAGGYCT